MRFVNLGSRPSSSGGPRAPRAVAVASSAAGAPQPQPHLNGSSFDAAAAASEAAAAPAGAAATTTATSTTTAAAASAPLVDPKLLELMNSVASGAVTPETAAASMRELSAGYQQVQDFAAVDAWRAQRTGFPEVVWAPGKSPEQIAAILQKLASNDRVALASRVDADTFQRISVALGPVDSQRLSYNASARLLSFSSPGGGRKQPRLPGTVVVLSAGTADEAVAEECRAVADAMGCYAFRLADVSVDGLHRVLHNLPAVRAADVVVVVSGTDGALPAVVAGLVEAPVVAVPTSVGYGAALSGVTPLLSALVASSPGVTVVNIDNGFGAAMVAARILRTAAKLRRVGGGSSGGAGGQQQQSGGQAPAAAGAAAAPATAATTTSVTVS